MAKISRSLGVDVEAIMACVWSNLVEHPAGMGEYELMKAVDDRGLFVDLSTKAVNLRLFQKHFLVRHSVYTLRKRYADDIWRISPMSIQRMASERKVDHPNSEDDDPGNSVSPAGDAYLEAFYLDFNNVLSATEDTVEDLLTGFWRRYQAWISGDEAYSTLGVSADASWADIQTAYRRLVQQAHPDKGGDEQAFSAIQTAYEQLKQVKNK